MLPLALVENKGFKDFIYNIDPSFLMPTRKTIKSTGVPALKDLVFIKLKNQLQTIQYPNISVDGWSDATARSFNGYVCQGIDDQWNLLTLSVDFRHLPGKIVIKQSIKFNPFHFIKGSHTGENIKIQYDDVIKSLDIEDRIIKVVCDQGANIKKAFKSTVEAEDVDLIKITKDLLIHQKQKDVSERLAQLESEHILEISEMNKFTGDGNTLKRKREQILDELDLEIDDLTDNESSDDDSNVEDDDDSVDELLNEVERLSNKWHYFD
jgi:hypothetical protein